MADEFDMSFFQNKGLDHGCFSPLSILLPHDPEWPTTIIPLQMGVLQFLGALAPRAATSSAVADPQRDRELSWRISRS